MFLHNLNTSFDSRVPQHMTIEHVKLEPYAENHEGLAKLADPTKEGGFGHKWDSRDVLSLGYNTAYNRETALPMVSNMVCRFIDHLEISRVIIGIGLVYYLLWGFHHLHNDIFPYDERAVVNMGSMGKTFHLRCQGREFAFHMDHGTVVIIDKELGVNGLGIGVEHGAFGDPTGSAIVIINMKKRKGQTN